MFKLHPESGSGPYRPPENAPLTHRDVTALLQTTSGDHPRRPLIVTTALIMKARGHPSLRTIELEEIVTPGSEDGWVMAHVARVTRGTGILTRQHQLGERWTEVHLVETDAERPFPALGPITPKLSVYVFKVASLQDWRVHSIGLPGLDPDAIVLPESTA